MKMMKAFVDGLVSAAAGEEPEGYFSALPEYGVVLGSAHVHTDVTTEALCALR